MKRLEWDNLHVLLAVVRTGNLKRAAQRLRLSTATLSRRLDALEEQLGGQLLERSSTGCLPTAFGQRIAGFAEQMEGAANEILREADSPESVEGTVRVNADEWLSFLVIALLAPIRPRHPLLDMEVLTTPHPVNLARREADLSLRYTEPETKDLSAERLGEIEFALYGASQYLDRHRPAIAARDWASLDFVGLEESRMDQDLETWWQGLDGAPAPWLRCNQTLGIYDGVIAGAGLGIVEKRTAKLTPTLELVMDMPGLTQEVWLCTHRSLRASARIKAVRDFLVEAWPQ
jgi:DNA-binding transcriptional LysR family regulator